MPVEGDNYGSHYRESTFALLASIIQQRVVDCGPQIMETLEQRLLWPSLLSVSCEALKGYQNDSSRELVELNVR
jgi:hypothetical protein